MRGKGDFQAAALVVLNVRAEFKASGSLLTRDGCEEVVVMQEEPKDKKAGELILRKLSAQATEDIN